MDRRPRRSAFTDEVLGSGSKVNCLIDTVAVRRMLADLQPAHASHAYALWAVWLLGRWLRRVEVPVAREIAVTRDF